MPNIHSHDPRALRTRTALIDAFKDLLEDKTLQKITITDITKRADIARHTFYNHYQTKQDLLVHLIDSVLDQFFSGLKDWNFYLANSKEELVMYTSFFQSWVDNADIAKLLMSVDIDNLVVDRLKDYFTQYYYQRIEKVMPDVNPIIAQYIVNFNAYSLMGVLKPWFADNMRFPPEVLAGFLIQLTGSIQRRKTVEKYKDLLK